MYKVFLGLMLGTLSASGQVPMSGGYRELSLAYDSTSGMATGYYENATGYDEETKQPKFFCKYYLVGKLQNGKARIKTFYTGDGIKDLIEGELVVIASNKISIKLMEDHGGCWNVEQFATHPVEMNLDQPAKWIQVRFADKDKVFFYSDHSAATKRKSYIVRGDVVFVDRILGGWAFCSFVNEETTTVGWIKTSELNHI